MYVVFLTDVFVVDLTAKKQKRDKHGMCVKRTKSSTKLKAGLLSALKCDLAFTIVKIYIHHVPK